MKRSRLILLISGVAALHVGLFLWLFDHPLPKRIVKMPEAFFSKREASWHDEATGEAFTYREFNVSTRLAMPDVLMERREKE